MFTPHAEMADRELLTEYHSLSQDLTMDGETVVRKIRMASIKREISRRDLDPNDYFAGGASEVNW